MPGVQVDLAAVAHDCNTSEADGRWRQENPQTFAGQRAWLVHRITKKTLPQRRRKTRPNTQRLFSDLDMPAAAYMSPYVYTETEGVMSAHTQI